MSTIDVGAQSIMATFQMPATAALFNRQLRDTLKPGIYAGGQVTIVAANSIQISEFVSVIRSSDLVGDKAVRLQTADPVILNTPNAPNGDYTLYLTYTYNAVLTNFADFNLRLTSSPVVMNEVAICRVVNDGAGIASTIEYDTRTRGSIDVDLGDRLTTDIDPTMGYHVGNRAYNDLRYVNHTGANNWDVQIFNSADGALSSVLKADLTSSRVWTLHDRSMILADNRAAFKVGDIKSTLTVITPSDTEPWFDINQDASIDPAVWPVLAPYLRALKGTVSGTDTFTVLSISTSGSPVTITLDTTVANDAFLLALAEEYNVHGSFVNFRTITINSDIGTFPAGTYGIQGFSTGARTITLTATYSGSSATGDFSYYPFRQPDAISVTNAYWYQISDAVLKTVGGDIIPYFRVRDRMQGHFHRNSTDNSKTYTGGAVVGDFLAVSFLHSATNGIGEPTDDGTNGTPRTGLTTRDRGLAVYKYIYGETFV